MRRKELQRLLNSAQTPPPTPKTVWIPEATYQATFVDGTLRHGTFAAEVRRLGDEPQFLQLDPLNLPLTDLRLEDRPADWGTTADGHLGMVVQRSQEKVTAAWNLTGRRLPQSVEFELQLAPATVSRIEVRLPDGFQLETSTGDLQAPTPAAETGSSLWRIDLGSRSTCRISVRETSAPQPRLPLVFVEQQTNYHVGEDGLSFQSEYLLEVHRAPVQQFQFVLPNEMEIFSVHYGSESPLHWRQIRRNQRSLLIVQLTDPLLGQSRPIRIRGHADAQIGRQWKLPQLRIAKAVLTNGQVSLQVSQPFEIQSLAMDGFRNRGTLIDDNGMTLDLQQYQPGGSVTLKVDYPALTSSVELLSQLQFTPTGFSLVTEARWLVHTGSTFVVECLVPREWEIVDVQAIFSDRIQRITEWKVDESNPRGRVLQIGFAEALDHEHPLRLQIHSRRLPVLPQQAFDLPLIEPIACNDVDRLLIVPRSSDSYSLELLNTSFARSSLADVPATWREFSLWKQFTSAKEQDYWVLQSRQLQPNGRMLIEAQSPPFTSRSSITSRLENNRFHENFVIECFPSAEPLDRVMVYLTTAADETEWLLLDDDRQMLSANRLPPARHLDWQLPPHGELWEIRLPEAMSEPFQISATRVQPFVSQWVCSLAFVPQAREFQGLIWLQMPQRGDLFVKADGLESPRTTPSFSIPLTDGATTSEVTTRRWTYSKLDGTLSVLTRENQESLQHQQAALLQLDTLVAQNNATHDLHRATITFQGEHEVGHFYFTLPAPGELIGLWFDDERTTPAVHQDQFVAPVPQTGPPPRRVRIEYRTPARRWNLWTNKSVPVPQVPYALAGFHWSLTLSPNLRLLSRSDDMLMRTDLPRVAWNRRLFGPLGRPFQLHSWFNPFDGRHWDALFGARQASTAVAEGSASRFATPVNWPSLQMDIARFPEHISISLWDYSTLSLIAWATMLGTICAGGFCRIYARSFAYRAGPIWLTACVVGALLAPGEIAEVFGGCVSGALIAAFLPTAWLRPATSRSAMLELATDTTVLSKPTSVASLILLAVGLTLPLIAQEVQPTTASPARSNGTAPVFDVLVPESAEDGAPPSADALVYLTGELIDYLHQWQTAPTKLPTYLIRSADYRGEVRSNRLESLQARFEVLTQPTAADDPIRIELPIRPANLGGPDACLVDGKPHPVLRSDDGKALLIDWQSPKSTGQSNPQTKKPPIDEKKAAPGMQSVAVELMLHPVTQTEPSLSHFDLTIPPISDSRLTLQFAENYQTVNLPGIVERVDEGGQLRSVTAQLGRRTALRADWSAAAEATTHAAEVSIAVRCLAEAHPTWAKLKLRADYTLHSGTIDYLVWSLPADAIVRRVQVDGLSSYRSIPVSETLNHLLIEMNAPHKGDFAVEVDLTVPASANGDLVTIPACDLHESGKDSRQLNIRQLQYQTVCYCPAEFEITPQFQESATIVSIDPKPFFAVVRKPVDADGQLWAYQLQATEPLTFAIAPRVPSRKVWQLQETRIEANRVRWKFLAEMQISNAPAFEHLLEIDPRLRIESVSVTENDAERLARWTRVGKRLRLFLRNKTTGIQQITVTASFPFSRNAPLRLPSGHVPDAVLAESKLLLYHDAGWNVVVPPSSPLTAREQPETSTAAPGKTLELLGEYDWTAPTQPVTVKVSEKSPPLQVIAATYLSLDETDHFRIQYLWNLKSGDRWPSTITLKVPSGLAENFTLRPADLPWTTDVAADGSATLTLAGDQLPSKELTLVLDGQLPAAQQKTWELPHPQLQGAQPVDEYTLIAGDVRYLPEQFVDHEIALRELPDGILRDFDRQHPDHALRLFSNLPHRKLYRHTHEDETFLATVPLAETQVWLQRDGRHVGRTILFVESHQEVELALRIPESLAPGNAFVNGEVVTPHSAEAGEMVVPLSIKEPVNLLVFEWTAKPGRRLPAVGQTAIPYILPAKQSVDYHLLTVIPPESVTCAVGDDVDTKWLRQQQLKVMEILEDICDSAYQEPAAVPAFLRQMLKLRTDQLAADLRLRNGDLQEWPIALQRRFLQFTERLERTYSHTPPAATPAIGAQFDASLTKVLSLPLTDKQHDLVSGRLMSSGKELSVTLFAVEQQLITMGFALLAVVIGLVALKYVLTPRIGDWLNQHPNIALTCLGVTWWLFLEPSVLGIAFVCWAGWRGFRGRRPDAPAELRIGAAKQA